MKRESDTVHSYAHVISGAMFGYELEVQKKQHPCSFVVRGTVENLVSPDACALALPKWKIYSGRAARPFCFLMSMDHDALQSRWGSDEHRDARCYVAHPTPNLAGTSSLRSRLHQDSFNDPTIDPQYFSHFVDLVSLREGTKLVRRIGQSLSLKVLIGEVSLVPDAITNEIIE